MKKKYFIILIILGLTGCSSEIEVKEIPNIHQGALMSLMKLRETSKKEFLLDSVTAPRAGYTQLNETDENNSEFTFINKNNNTIYVYNYETSAFLKKIALNSKWNNKRIEPIAYYIKSKDSIYVYNRLGLEILLAKSNGAYYEKISLINNKRYNEFTWTLNYPQYDPQTANPFIAIADNLLLPGQFVFSIPDSIVNNFKFVAYINLKNNKVNFEHKYPSSLYGGGANWAATLFNCPFITFNPVTNKIIFSFPVSHNLYIADLKSNNYKIIYGGSNSAGTITSSKVDKKDMTQKMISDEFVRNDVYGLIKYDKYRNVYYRFLTKGIPHSLNKENTATWKDKPVSIIIMDDKFKYLGETEIGTQKNWYLPNTFVTKEGLNIEYIPNNLNENYLILKTFTLTK